MSLFSCSSPLHRNRIRTSTSSTLPHNRPEGSITTTTTTTDGRMALARRAETKTCKGTKNNTRRDVVGGHKLSLPLLLCGGISFSDRIEQSNYLRQDQDAEKQNDRQTQTHSLALVYLNHKTLNTVLTGKAAHGKRIGPKRPVT